MFLTILKEDYDKAIEELNNNRNLTCQSCLVAQAAKRTFGDNFKTVGYYIRLKDHTCLTSKDPKALLIIIRKFDNRKKNLRSQLPITLELEKIDY